MKGEKTKRMDDLISTFPFLKVLSGGKGKMGEALGREGVGFCGECFDFAVAVKRIIGGKYVYRMFQCEKNVDHVLVEINGHLIDADGIHDKDEYIKNSRGFFFRYPLDSDVEFFAEPRTVECLVCALEFIDRPEFTRWKECVIGDVCPCEFRPGDRRST